MMLLAARSAQFSLALAVGSLVIATALSASHVQAQSTQNAGLQQVATSTVRRPVNLSDVRRLEEAIGIAARGNGIIDSYGEAGSSTGLVGLTHRSATEITLVTLATQLADAPWYGLQSCELSDDALSVIAIHGAAASEACRALLLVDAAVKAEPVVVEKFALLSRDHGAQLAAAVLKARDLRTHCRQLADGDLTLHDQCADELRALPSLARGQTLRTPAELLAWVEVMDAKQSALRVLEGWQASEPVGEELIHLLKSIRAPILAQSATQTYLKLDGLFFSMCVSECYPAQAWELVEALAARNAAVGAGLQLLEQELSAALEGAIAGCGIDGETAAQLRADLALYTGELEAAVPTTVRITPKLAHEISERVRKAVCDASDETSEFRLIIRCRNDLLNEMWSCFGKLLHESDLVSDHEAAVLRSQVDAINQIGKGKVESWIQFYLAARGEQPSKNFTARVAAVLASLSARIELPFTDPWATWNVFPLPAAAITDAREEVDRLDMDRYSDDTEIDPSMFLLLLESGSWGLSGIPTLASMGAGGAVLGMADQRLQVRGIRLQPFTNGGASVGGSTPFPWRPRLWTKKAPSAR